MTRKAISRYLIRDMCSTHCRAAPGSQKSPFCVREARRPQELLVSIDRCSALNLSAQGTALQERLERQECCVWQAVNRCFGGVSRWSAAVFAAASAR